VKREEAAKKQAEEEAKKKAESEKKPGSWGGLPGIGGRR